MEKNDKNAESATTEIALKTETATDVSLATDGAKKSDKPKRKRGDRKDGRRIRKLDSMHAFMPYLLPNRTDNEACMNDYIDVTELDKYVAEKNANSPSFKYTVFHYVLAALGKTIVARPKMNYFYQGHRLYERNNISFAFTAKRKFEDKSDEALAIMRFDTNDERSAVEQMHQKVEKFVTKVRKMDENDGATDIMGTLVKFPRFMIKFIVHCLNRLDYHGWLPKDFLEYDPYHCTVFVSNLGSIKATASYHHLANWGTNSVFVIIGEIKNRPVFDEAGNVVFKRMMPVGLTVDERIADGFYFAKSFKLFKYLLEHPAILEEESGAPVDFESLLG